MASANVFNVGSANQNQMLSANAAAGKTKADKSDKVAVFSTIMNANYSANPNVSNVMDRCSGSDMKNTDAASTDYEQYQYRDKQIDSKNPIIDKINNNSEEISNVQKDLVHTVAETLDIDDEKVVEAMEMLGMTAFDLLDSQKLAQLVQQIQNVDSPQELLLNPQFTDLMQKIQDVANDFMDTLEINENQFADLISQMELVENETVAEIPQVETPVMPERAEKVLVTVDVPDTDDTYLNQMERTVENTDTPQTVDVSKEAQSYEANEDAGAGSGEQLKQNEPTIQKESRTPEPTGEISFSVSEQMPQNVTTVSDVDTQYLSIDTMDLIEQIAENVKVNISQETTSMQMQLNPENLGKIYLEVSVKAGNIHAELAASDEAVRTALEAQVAELRASLNQAGLKVDSIEVTVASHEFERNLEQGQAREEQEGERQQEQASSRRRNISMSSLDELSGLMTEEETLAAQMMRDNGNSVDFTA